MCKIILIILLSSEPSTSCSSNIKDHWSQITVTNIIIRKRLKYCENYQNVTQRREVSKLLENGTNRLARCRVATNLQFVKNTVSAKCNKMKCNQLRSACRADRRTCMLISGYKYCLPQSLLFLFTQNLTFNPNDKKSPQNKMKWDKIVNRARYRDGADVETIRNFKITIINILRVYSGKSGQHAWWGIWPDRWKL